MLILGHFGALFAAILGHLGDIYGDFVTYIPRTDEHFAASLAVVPLQLMGYYVAVAKGLDVDKPRNLAKSVTVE